MVNNFKLLSDDEKLGVWLDEITYINIMKICYTRNRIIFNKLKEDYEYLTRKNFDFKLIGVSKYKE